MSRPDKATIRRAFERAASRYDTAADLQRQVCDSLAESLPGIAPPTILDAGCGTGYAQPILASRYPDAVRFALDLSQGMLAGIGASTRRLVGDIEHLPLADASIDLYWSSLAVQWCDAPRMLAEAHRVLAPGGQLCLATLGPATFHELRKAFATVDRHVHTLGFCTAERLLDHAQSAGVLDCRILHRPITTWHADLRALLHSVKAIGANQLGPGRRTGLMSRGDLARLASAYELQRGPRGLPLTYDVLELTARQP